MTKIKELNITYDCIVIIRYSANGEDSVLRLTGDNLLEAVQNYIKAGNVVATIKGLSTHLLSPAVCNQEDLTKDSL